MNCWSHRPRSSGTSHSIDKPLFIRWWPGLFVFTIWSATELKKKYREGSHLDPRNIYTMVTPLLEWSLKDRVTLKTGVMMLEIQLRITGINYILKYIKINIF